MRRIFLILCLLLSWSGTAWAQGSPSSLPLATLPLDGNDAVWVDEGTGCPNQPCTSKKSPSTRVGQPVQQPMGPVTPFDYQQWIDTSQNPPQLKQFFGATWHLATTLDRRRSATRRRRRST